MAISLTAQAATEVLPLQHRTSAEMLPTAQSFLGKDGTVSTFENKLIVNASPERIDDLRALLQQLDTAPKRLLISVDNDDSNFQTTVATPASSITARATVRAGCSRSRPAKASRR